ncbi:MAG: hypothetical protein ABI068_09620, partial [Ktedonobacterales bacterium]
MRPLSTYCMNHGRRVRHTLKLFWRTKYASLRYSTPTRDKAPRSAQRATVVDWRLMMGIAGVNDQCAIYVGGLQSACFSMGDACMELTHFDEAGRAHMVDIG